MYQAYRYLGETLYIAGPLCFYPAGYELWQSRGKEAKYYGFSVAIPSDKELKLDHEDIRKNADAIFQNCADGMNESTAILADLEQFRGSEPDGGTVFEMGMAYARGLRCYAFTRDGRDHIFKHQALRMANGEVRDAEGRILPYYGLPFCPSIVGSSKILEGSFSDCLKLLMVDLDEERKNRARRIVPAEDKSTQVTVTRKDRPLVYLSGPERYDADAAETYARMKKLCDAHGFDVVTPLDEAPGVPAIETDDAYAKACNQFDRCQQHIRNCDILIANLDDFHGYEPSSDVSFESGMAWQLGKKCFGYLTDTSRMLDRVPNHGEDAGGVDYWGYTVENFNYPLNLMFSSSMPVFEGSFEDIVAKVAEQSK